MAGAEQFREPAVILAALIRIADHHRETGSGGNAFKHAGEDFDPVRFLAHRADFGLSGPPPVEVALDQRLIDLHPCRHPIDDHSQSGTVGLPERGHSEQFAKRISAHGFNSVRII